MTTGWERLSDAERDLMKDRDPPSDMSEETEFKALMAMHEAGPHAKRKRPAYDKDVWTAGWECALKNKSYISVADANAQRVKSGQEILASMRLPRVERIPPSEWVHPSVRGSDDRTKRVEPSESFYEEYARIDPKSYEELLVADPRLAVMKPLEHVAPVEGHLDYTKLQKLYDRHLNKILAITGLNQPLEPVPDSPSETELTEVTRLREFWRDRCFAAETNLVEARREVLKKNDYFQIVSAQLNAQIVRLMAERDEARNLLAVANDKLTPFLAAEPKPEPELKHNPFRVIEKDRRMMGP